MDLYAIALRRGRGTHRVLSEGQARREWVMGGYRGTLLEWAWARLRIAWEPVRRPPGQQGFVRLARRWGAERTVAWLTQCRRFSKDYERLPASSEAWIYIAMIRLMLRRLA